MDAEGRGRIAGLLGGPDETERLSQTFKVLGDPTRLRILSALVAGGATTVGDLARAVATSESGVSSHLRLLRSLMLVRARREGRLVYYSLSDEHVERLLLEGLRHVAAQQPAAESAGPRAAGRRAAGPRAPGPRAAEPRAAQRRGRSRRSRAEGRDGHSRP